MMEKGPGRTGRKTRTLHEPTAAFSDDCHNNQLDLTKDETMQGSHR